MRLVINHVCSKTLPEQLGLHCYAVSTHPDELVFDPHLKILDPPVITLPYDKVSFLLQMSYRMIFIMFIPLTVKTILSCPKKITPTGNYCWTSGFTNFSFGL